MKIVYIAKHDSGGNDDEGGIYYALQQLGHEVLRIREVMGKKAYKLKGDFILFHKWDDIPNLCKLKIPKVFWYFDLVDYPDSAFADRSRARVTWMENVIPNIDLGFCTDGDWVDNWNSEHKEDGLDRLFWLPQGIDERSLVLNKSHIVGTITILFTGIKRGGTQRSSFVDEMVGTYATDFTHITKGVYGKELQELIAKAEIVVAPDGPVTDRYWSNRVYLTIGMGGFMIHPYCERLTRHYTHTNEIVYYNNRTELHSQIEYYRNNPQEILRIARSGAQHTARSHTYKHRCELLLAIVKECVL